MKYEIWDKKSPINGIDAERFIGMMGYQADDAIYIIYNDENQPWIVQAERTSPYPGKSVQEKAMAHLNSLVPVQEEVKQEEEAHEI